MQNSFINYNTMLSKVCLDKLASKGDLHVKEHCVEYSNEFYEDGRLMVEPPYTVHCHEQLSKVLFPALLRECFLKNKSP